MPRYSLLSLFLIGLFLFAGNARSEEDSNFKIVQKGTKQILVEYTGDAETVEIPEGVTSIGDDAFSGCDSVKSIVIPKGVTKIGDNAFSDCTSLTLIVFPKGVKKIGDDLFDGCENLTIRAPKGSKIEEYAKKNGITFKVSSKKANSSKNHEEEQSVALDGPQETDENTTETLAEDPVDEKSQVEDAQTTEASTSKPKDLQNVTVPDDYPTIEEAYSKVKDGGIITIQPGKYELSETIVVNRNVTFRGSTGRAEDVVINCPSSNAFEINRGSPSFQNLTSSSERERCGGFCVTGGTPKFFHCTITSSNGCGMYVEGEDADPMVESCVFKDCSLSGLVVSQNGLGTFNDCEICGNEALGITVISSGNPTVTRCKIHDGKSIGVGIVNGLGTFKDCEIYENEVGIEVSDSGNPTITRCKIHDEKVAGVKVNSEGLGKFNDCEIYGNTLAGIAVTSSGNPTVSRCKIHDGEKLGVIVMDNGLGAFNDCEIYGNGGAGIEVHEKGNPTVTGGKFHDGEGPGVRITKSGLGTFNDCEIYRNTAAGICVEDFGNPTVTGCNIHDGKGGGVGVFDGGKGTFNNNVLKDNYIEGMLANWVILPNAGEVKGSGNTPKISSW